ncbi:MAG TPA: CAP domain-containing protein, partial [Candidatus Syntrophosphaera sp.]|nr:CAP domain-containing protein [Candidatus Syntrophosphaera sp.]
MKGIYLGLLLLLPLAGLGADTLSPGEFARQIHAEINAIRGRNGLPELIWRDDLAGLALRHSQNMGKQDFFNHVDPEGLQVSQRLRKHL